MKSSHYNMIFPCPTAPEKRIVFNAFSGALAILDETHYDFIKSMGTAGFTPDIAIQQELEEAGFVVSDDLDQRALVHFRDIKARFNKSSIGLTIVSTLDCDFRCTYCQQWDTAAPVYMTGSVEDKIVAYCESRVAVDNARQMSIAWYGGEPLLAMDTVERLSVRLIDLCEQHGLGYYAAMVTNGYSLTRDTIDRLADLQVGSIQVTLDGPPEIHDKRRVTTNGEPTFSRILQNLRNAASVYRGDLVVRINVDMTNLEDIDQLVAALKSARLDEAPNVSVYAAPVLPVNGCYDPTLCISTRAHAEAQLDLLDLLADHGWQDPYMRGLMMRPKRTFCTATQVDGLVIGPSGELYKCWSDVGRREFVVGNIASVQAIENSPRFLGYVNSQPRQECYDCRLRPVCGAGCPRDLLEDGVSACSQIKYNLSQVVSRLATRHAHDAGRPE